MDINMEIREKTIKILSAHSDKENVNQYLHENDDLTQLGMNSITFIKMVVALESEFNFEFEDEALDYQKFSDLSLLYEYIAEQMLKNSIVYSGTAKEDERLSIKNELIYILSKYIEDSRVNNSDFNDLSVLKISPPNMNYIFSDIQAKYQIKLNEDIISQKQLFYFDNLCDYILYKREEQ